MECKTLAFDVHAHKSLPMKSIFHVFPRRPGLEVGPVLFEVIFFLENELSPFFMHDFYFVTDGDGPQDRRKYAFSELFFLCYLYLWCSCCDSFGRKGSFVLNFVLSFTSNGSVFVTKMRV